MFTSIVEEAGVIEKITPAKKSIEMTVRAGICGRGAKIGDSVAVNGCCLTVIDVAGETFAFEDDDEPARHTQTADDGERRDRVGRRHDGAEHEADG